MTHTPKTITRAQYLQLLGLQLLAANHWRAIEDLEKAAYTITDERDGDGSLETCGHTSDILLDKHATIDDLLKRLSIIVS
jgi:hypothetical protein